MGWNPPCFHCQNGKLPLSRLFRGKQRQYLRFPFPAFLTDLQQQCLYLSGSVPRTGKNLFSVLHPILCQYLQCQAAGGSAPFCHRLFDTGFPAVLPALYLFRKQFDTQPGKQGFLLFLFQGIRHAAQSLQSHRHRNRLFLQQPYQRTHLSFLCEKRVLFRTPGTLSHILLSVIPSVKTEKFRTGSSFRLLLRECLPAGNPVLPEITVSFPQCFQNQGTPVGKTGSYFPEILDFLVSSFIQIMVALPVCHK